MTKFGSVPVDEKRVGFPRPNFCGGAVCYDAEGRRYRRNCQNDAVESQALCKSCHMVETEQRASDLARVKSKAGDGNAVASRGRRWE